MRQRFARPSVSVSDRMKKIKSSETQLEKRMREILDERGIGYEFQPCLPGHPDFRIAGTNILLFCDSSFWHGRRGADVSGKSFSKNREFWTEKLRRNKRRDSKVTKELRKAGWNVVRIWDTTILKKPNAAAEKVLELIG